MLFNRSVPPSAVIPVLRYPSPQDAAKWLQEAFGFTVRLKIANHRIQMWAGGGCFTIAEGDVVPNGACTIQVRIRDAVGHSERARLGGARILGAVQEEVYGERQYSAVDFHGYTWNFTETLADVEPESWGGESVAL